MVDVPEAFVTSCTNAGVVPSVFVVVTVASDVLLLLTLMSKLPGTVVIVGEV